MQRRRFVTASLAAPGLGGCGAGVTVVDGDDAPSFHPEAEARLADFVLHPCSGYWVSLSREYRERTARGLRADAAQAPRLPALLS